MNQITNSKPENQYLSYPLIDIRIEISKRQIQSGNNTMWSYAWIGKKIGKTNATVSFVLNDTSDLSPKAKAKIRKKICTLLKAYDKKETEQSINWLKQGEVQ
jgi:hypothetical protein